MSVNVSVYFCFNGHECNCLFLFKWVFILSCVRMNACVFYYLCLCKCICVFLKKII
jgi:hypothetical protein